jgi:hypothetical protein
MCCSNIDEKAQNIMLKNKLFCVHEFRGILGNAIGEFWEMQGEASSGLILASCGETDSRTS